jgi:Hexokinase
VANRSWDGWLLGAGSGFVLTRFSCLLFWSGLGGTNLRVCLVTLSGDGKFEITQSKYRLTEEQKQEDGQKLFDFCAECVKTFIDSNMHNVGDFLVDGARIPLGFTVSIDFLAEDDLHVFLHKMH